jgi:hypothetical protein
MAHVGVSASAPVNARNTPPITAKAMSGFASTKRAASPGLSALRISGAAQMLMTPSKPITTNQLTMIGPNRRPILAVPRRCIMNSPIRIASVSGKMKSSNAGATSLRPSMAESTEMAGVMTPSP